MLSNRKGFSYINAYLKKFFTFLAASLGIVIGKKQINTSSDIYEFYFDVFNLEIMYKF